MPIHLRKEGDNYYYQYGETGHKYYVKSRTVKGFNNAYEKCLKQVKAIHSTKL